MKRFDLIKITYRYFKGLIDFTLEPNGKDAKVSADNGLGKTSLFDGLTFLLFDKDSENQSPSQFGIKTTDKYGIPIPGVSHEVEGVFQYGPRLITLKKVYSEVWTKQRGSTTAQMTGNTTDYFIDGVPMQLKEYSAEIGKIVSEETFKLLTNPRYFSTEKMFEWKKRRKLLLDIGGDVTDEDVIASNGNLSGLTAILNGRDIDSQRKVVLAQRKEINNQIEALPTRIDEANRSKPDTSGLDEKGLTKQIEAKRLDVSNKESEINRIRSGSEITLKQNRIREIDGELLSIKNQVEADSYKKVSTQRGVVDDAKRNADFIMADIRKCENSIRQNDVTIYRKRSDKDELSNRFVRINSEVFPAFLHEGTDSCPACKQSLPHDQVMEAVHKAKTAYDNDLAYFNQGKSKRLEDINVQGKALKSEITELEAENVSSNKAIETLNNQLITARENLHAAELELTRLSDNIQKADADPLYLAKQTEKAEVEAEIASLRNSTQEAVQKVAEEIQGIRDVIIALEQEQAKFDQVRKAEARIDELKGQERDLAAEFERTERELWLLDEFTKQKVSMLESKINSKFKITRFKLFEIQVNGGLKELCEPTNLEGVPYSGGLNNAARINCGLDIINTLSKHFCLAAPIFIDNAEGVTRPIETHGQQIRLVVNEKDQKLRVDMVQQKVMEAV